MKPGDLDIVIEYYSMNGSYLEIEDFRELVKWRAELFHLIQTLAGLPRGVCRVILMSFEKELAEEK